MEWYYAQNGTQKGPLSEADLKNLLASGQVAQTDLVWHDGMAEWTPAAQVPTLSKGPASAMPATAPTGGAPYQTPAAQNPMAGGVSNVHIPNYLWQSIVVTLFCCLIGGIIAIVYAAKVDGLKAAGDIAGAQAASKTAKTWCWVSFGTGLVVTLAYIVLMFVSAGSAASGSY